MCIRDRCGLWRCNDRKAKRILSELIEAGKVEVVGGKLVNRKAVDDASALNRLRADRASAGRRGGTESAKLRANALKNNKPPQANELTREEKRREELEEEREAIASPKKTGPASRIAIRLAEIVNADAFGLPDADECIVIWQALGLTIPEILDEAQRWAIGHPVPERAADLDPVMNAAANAKRKPKTTTAKGERLPEGWQLPRSWGQWAFEEGMPIEEIRRQADMFRDYWHGLPGARGRKADWQATWRNWIRKAIEDGKGGRHGRTGTAAVSEGPKRPDHALANIARLAGLGAAPGDAGSGAGGSVEEAGPVRLGP